VLVILLLVEDLFTFLKTIEDQESVLGHFSKRFKPLVECSSGEDTNLMRGYPKCGIILM